MTLNAQEFMNDHRDDTLQVALRALVVDVCHALAELERKLEGSPALALKDEVSALSGEVGGLLERVYALELVKSKAQAQASPAGPGPEAVVRCYCGAECAPGRDCTTCGRRTPTVTISIG